MGRAMIDLYGASFRQVPKRIVLDIDDTFDAVHGSQQLRLFNAHYDEYGFQPIVVFDGEGRFVTAVLRPAKRPKGMCGRPVWTPPPVQEESLDSCGAGSGAAMCPASCGGSQAAGPYGSSWIRSTSLK